MTDALLDDINKSGGYDEEKAQPANLFLHCDKSMEGTDFVEELRDRSGSSVWIRLGDVALISAPLTHIASD